MTVAFVFPGQGSQAVGMGAELANGFASARAVFDEVDEALEFKLSDIIWNGPENDLTLTENAQPALMAVSLAAVAVLEAEHGVRLAECAHCVAGHSLGEYSALAAAGTFSVGDTARLLRTRGQAMQKAVPVGEGAMAAILGITFEKARELATAASHDNGRDVGICQTANDNAPGQVVLSGAKAAVDRAVAMAKEFGAKRALPLNVSAPFHCHLMEPAADVMAEALSDVEMKAPAVPLIANVLAAPVSHPDDIRRHLVEQVTGTVRWRESVMTMADGGVTTLVETGAGKVLSGLARQIDRSLKTHQAGTPDEIAAVAEALGSAS